MHMHVDYRRGREGCVQNIQLGNELNIQNVINKMFASSAVLCCAFLRSFKFSSSCSLGQLMCKEKARTL